MFENLMRRWGLTAEGEPLAGVGGVVLFVRQGGAPAVLKIATNPEERRGAFLMTWYGGDGAARVLAHQHDALLLERASDDRSLTAMAKGGQDDEATAILCEVATRLHRPRTAPRPELVPLKTWFRALEPAARTHGGALARAHAAAAELFAEPRDVIVLHGDIHHGNVLHDAVRGWLAIDPKGHLGERGYDYANKVLNPEVALAAEPGRMARRIEVIAQAAGLERRRLLLWVLAYTGLSSAWTMQDGSTPHQLVLADIAAALLDGG